MKLNSRLASHVLTPILLLTLGVLVFHRSGLKRMVGRGAAASAGSSARQDAGRERLFRAEGVGLLGAISSKGSSLGLRPLTTTDSGAMIEPAARDLFIDGRATELGAFQGILEGSRLLAGRRIANLTLHGDDGNAIRLILRSMTGAASDDCTGTYLVLGGTGKFGRATGKGRYHYAPIVPQQWETVSIALEGTVCY